MIDIVHRLEAGVGIDDDGLCADAKAEIVRLRELTDELAAAVVELLKGGEHDGPCDEGSDWGGCDQHLAAAKRRAAGAASTLATYVQRGAAAADEAAMIRNPEFVAEIARRVAEAKAGNVVKVDLDALEAEIDAQLDGEPDDLRLG